MKQLGPFEPRCQSSRVMVEAMRGGGNGGGNRDDVMAGAMVVMATAMVS